MIKYILKKIIPLSVVRIVQRYIHIIRSKLLHIIKRSPFVQSKYEILFLGNKNKHSFFGYYDITPFNSKTSEVIYLELRDNLKTADIVLENLENKTKNIIANTKAWNWQQGCRLRWLPKSSDKVIFNDYIEGMYCARIYNVRTGEERRLRFPLYDINNTGNFGITLNFSRLGIKRPGYGYTVAPYMEPADLANEGLYLVDIEANTSTKILNYSQIAEILKMKIQNYKYNYLNHLSFSPSGDKFLFFYLSTKPSYKAYLLVYNLSDFTLSVLESELNISHYVWEDDNHIIGTSCDSTHCGHYRYDMHGNRTQILPKSLIRDGHPSLYKDGKILCDTYPDKLGYQDLFLYDEKIGEINTLARIFSDPRYGGEKRTDLHPRFNSNKTKISFDTNINGYRKFCYFDMNKDE